MSEKAAQLVFPGFRFGSDDPAVAERLVDLGVGGFCLYGGKAAEVAQFTRRLQERARVPLLFCGDYEDGIASHVSGGTRFPTNMALGASGREALAYQKGLLTAIEARAIGVRWVLAPVLDLATCAPNPIVNVRSFGADCGLVAKLGFAYMKGLSAGKALSCAKHFPGHGETRRDSHLELPVLRLTRARLMRRELIPYIRTRGLADSVMAAHIHFPVLEPSKKVPASLSKKVVSGLLRKELRYSGLVVTDALSMNAVAKHFREDKACEAAILAGADILLVPADPLKTAESFPKLAQADGRLRPLVEAAFSRLEKAKRACGLFGDRGIVPEAELGRVGSSRHRELAEKMAESCLTWVRRSKAGGLPGRVRYLEPEASSPEEWRGKAFVEGLRSLGVEVEPYRPGGGPVLVASFLRPRAYSGKIQFSAEELRPVQTALSERRDSVLVSFASPFVFDQFRGYQAGLCAFSHDDGSQKAAAGALTGRLEALGRMPVALKVMGRPPHRGGGFRG